MRLFVILAALLFSAAVSAQTVTNYQSASSLAKLGGLKGYQIVGTASGPYGINGQVAGGNITAQSYQMLVLPYGATDIRLVYAGFYTNAIETVYPNSIFVPTAVTITNTSASGYAIGDTITMPNTGSGATATKLIVTAVATGVPTQVNFVEPGWYNTALAANTAASSTSGSGTGTITYSFTYVGYAYAVRVSVINPFIVATTNTTLSGYTFGTNGLDGQGVREYNILVPSGGYGVSDAIAVNVGAGVKIGLAQWSSGPLWITGRKAQTALGERANSGAAMTDFTQSGTVTANTNQRAIQPALVIGHVPTPSSATPSIIVAPGDSIGQATYSIDGGTTAQDAGDTNGMMGPIERGLNSNYAFATFAEASERASYWLTGATMRQNMLRGLFQSGVRFDVVVGQAGINDTNNSVTAATLEADYKIEWAFFQSIGVRNIIQTTLTPYTTTNDNWATSGSTHQTLAGSQPNRATFNADLLSGALRPTTAANIFCVVDLASVSESPASSGYWLGANGNGAVNATYDGLHPALLFLPNLATKFLADAAPCLTVNF